jgi:hypothetical protein
MFHELAAIPPFTRLQAMKYLAAAGALSLAECLSEAVAAVHPSWRSFRRMTTDMAIQPSIGDQT